MIDKDSRTFCILPWVHMHVWPSGKTFPCCMADPDISIGNTQHESIEKIWNSGAMRQLRLNIIHGTESKECHRCYELEEHGIQTLRQSSNANFKHLIDKVNDTDIYGNAGEPYMAYLDIRFSNLCNLRCRSCGPEFSSGWFEEHSALYDNTPASKIIQVRDNMSTFMDELEGVLDDVERVYWAGGEPLITDEHYYIIDKWIKANKTDVKMVYTTNFSQLTYKGKSIFDYWNKFKHVTVAASLDANHARGEYLRKNLNWDKVVQNRRDMIEQCPHVYFEISPTVSVYNIFNLPDFHREWIEEGLIEPRNIRTNMLLSPEYMKAQLLPQKMKDAVRKKYAKHITYLKQFENIKSTIEQYNNILHFLGTDDINQKNNIQEWNEQTLKLDKLRNENVFKIFPELKGLKPGILASLKGLTK